MMSRQINHGVLRGGTRGPVRRACTFVGGKGAFDAMNTGLDALFRPCRRGSTLHQEVGEGEVGQASKMSQRKARLRIELDQDGLAHVGEAHR